MKRIMAAVVGWLFGFRESRYEWPDEEPRSFGGQLRASGYEPDGRYPDRRGRAAHTQMTTGCTRGSFRRYAKRDELIQARKHARRRSA